MTCIEDTYWYLYNEKDKDNYYIVHAIVERNSDGLRHPHAVVLHRPTSMIWEVSNSFRNKPIKLPFVLWARLGHVSDIKQYSFDEFNNLILKHKVWDFYHLH